MSAGPLRLGTRRSPLARAQSEEVAARLREVSGRAVVLVDVTTTGDVDRAPLSQIGGTGVFASALREALLDGTVDLAVHSMKDLPTAPAEGLVVAAVPPREDPRDVLVGAALADLRPGARVGTGSPRRAAQLRALGLGLEVVDVRGNVGTRVGFVTSGRLDAVVLAAAGMLRLGRADEVTEVLEEDQLLPAPAQGALALECRADDEQTLQALLALDDPAARAATTAERALLAALEAGCTAPIGALARRADGELGGVLQLRAVVAAPDGSRVLRRSATGDAGDPVELGRRLAGELLADGAADLVLVGPGAPAVRAGDEEQPGSRSAGAAGAQQELPDVAPAAAPDPGTARAAAPGTEPPTTEPPTTEPPTTAPPTTAPPTTAPPTTAPPTTAPPTTAPPTTAPPTTAAPTTAAPATAAPTTAAPGTAADPPSATAQQHLEPVPSGRTAPRRPATSQESEA